MNQETEDFDIVVTGGGVIGAALVLELGALGYRVAMVESRAMNFEHSKPERVVALTHGSRCHLERLGVWNEMAASGFGRIEHVHVSEPGNRGQVDLGADSVRERASGIDALGYVLEIADILQSFYPRLEDVATLLCPARVTSIQTNHDTVRVQIDQEGRKRSIMSRLLIAADGTASPVRRMCGVGTLGWDHNRFALVASISCLREHENVAYECFRSAGPLAFLPLDDGRYSIVWTLPPRDAARMLQAPESAFLERLEVEAGPEILKRFGGLVETGPRAVYPLELTIAERIVEGRVIFAGNAAHTLHPVAGQGMNLGLRDVGTLSDIFGRNSIIMTDPGSSIALDEYAQRRWVDVMKIVGFTESLATVFGNDHLPLRWARGWGLRGLQSISPLRELLLKQASGIEIQTRKKLRRARFA